MPEVEPLRWTMGRRVLGTTTQGRPSSPIFYTAPGGWIITSEPDDRAPDRPWVLRRLGEDQGRFHTLTLAKAAPTRADLLAPRLPEDYEPDGADRDFARNHLRDLL